MAYATNEILDSSVFGRKILIPAGVSSNRVVRIPFTDSSGGVVTIPRGASHPSPRLGKFRLRTLPPRS